MMRMSQRVNSFMARLLHNKNVRYMMFTIVLSSVLFLAACGSQTSIRTGSEVDESRNKLTGSTETVEVHNNQQGSSQESTDKGKKWIIGATQIVEHPSLDDAYRGFQQALSDQGLNIEYNLQNAQGDMNNAITIANNFVADHVDLIFANSTPSAQAALQATKEIPIIFTSVTDPVGAGLVPSMNQGGKNITGTTDTHPDAIKKMVEFMYEEVDKKKIGMVYNAGEQNSVAQVDTVKKVVKDLGYDLVIKEASVANSSEVKQAAESLVGQIDAYYIISDNTVVTAIESVVKVANDNKLPVFTAEFDSLKRGSFAAYGFRYYDIGYQAGEIAALILTEKKKPEEIPPAYPAVLQLIINKQAAEKQGVILKPEWDNIAEYIE